MELQDLRGFYDENHELARYTSFRVGGKADRFFRPADFPDLRDFLKMLPEDEPITWLGLGSNVLIRDGGIRGTVIHTLARLTVIEVIDAQTIQIAAGVTCAKLAKCCAKLGFIDGAFFAGIPGTVGGALKMNAGAYGWETWDLVTKVQTSDYRGNTRWRSKDEFVCEYRSVEGLGDEFFVSAEFRFPTEGTQRDTRIAIRDLLQARARTQPVGTFNCGSVFRNPPNDHAARLIEASGLKGYAIGGARVSEKHANFIVNDGSATAANIEQLIEHVQGVVAREHGVELRRECLVLGD